MVLKKIAVAFFSLFFAAIASISSPSAFAGAISAGGLIAPPNWECLFENSESNVVPYSVAIYTRGTNHSFGQFTLLDLENRKPKFNKGMMDVVFQSVENNLVISATVESSSKPLVLSIDLVNARTPDAFEADFADIFELEKVYRVELSEVFKAQLEGEGIDLKGYCSPGLLYYYELP